MSSVAQVPWPGGLPWIQPGHNEVTQLAVAPGGQYLATSGDETVKVWKMDGTYIRTYDFYPGAIAANRQVALSQTANRLVNLDDARNGQVWTSNPLVSPSSFNLVIPSADLVLTPDGQRMLVSNGRVVELRTLPDAALVQSFTFPVSETMALTLTASGATMVAGSRTGEVLVVRAADGVTLASYRLNALVTALDARDDGNEVAVLTAAGRLHLLHPGQPLLDDSALILGVEEGQALAYVGTTNAVAVLTVANHVKQFSTVTLLPTGHEWIAPAGTQYNSLDASSVAPDVVVGTSWGQALHLNLATGTVDRVWGNRGGRVWRMERDLGSDDLFALRNDSLQRLNGSTGQVMWTLPDPMQDFYEICSLTSNKGVIGTSTGLKTLNTQTGVVGADYVLNDVIDRMAARADGLRYAYALSDGSIVVRSGTTHVTVVKDTPVDNRTILALAWVRDELLVAADEAGITSVYRWNPTTGARTALVPTADIWWPGGIAVSDDGTQACIYGGYNLEDILFDPWVTDAAWIPLTHSESLTDADFLPDGRLIATGLNTLIFDAGGNVETVITDGGATISALAILRNPRQVALGRADGTLMVGGLLRSLIVNTPDFQGDYSRFGYTVQVHRVSDGGVVQNSQGKLSATGEVFLTTNITESAEITLKAGHWLSRKFTFDFARGPAGLRVTLVNGDIDRDDSVTVFDYDRLSANFDRTSADADWTVEDANGIAPRDTDLDGDGAVTVFDYDILSQNFDRTGEA